MELTANAVRAWRGAVGVQWHCTAPDKLMWNDYVTRFNGRAWRIAQRGTVLSMGHARVQIAAWVGGCNQDHRVLSVFMRLCALCWRCISLGEIVIAIGWHGIATAACPL